MAGRDDALDLWQHAGGGVLGKVSSGDRLLASGVLSLLDHLRDALRLIVGHLVGHTKNLWPAASRVIAICHRNCSFRRLPGVHRPATAPRMPTCKDLCCNSIIHPIAAANAARDAPGAIPTFPSAHWAGQAPAQGGAWGRRRAR